MFKKKSVDADIQVPYELYASINKRKIHRRRWIVEIGLALVIVIVLTTGIIWLTNNRKKHTDTQPLQPQQQITQQQPQENNTPASSSSKTPDTIDSGNTNTSGAPRPQ